MLVQANEFEEQELILFSLSLSFYLQVTFFQSGGYVVTSTNIPSKLSKNIYYLDSLVGMTFDLLLTFDRIELKSVFNNFNIRLK